METTAADAPANIGSGPVSLVSIRGLSKYYVRGDQVIPVLVDINLDDRRRRLSSR